MYSEDTYQATLDLAQKKLRSLDEDRLSRNKGVAIDDSTVRLVYFRRSYRIGIADGAFSPGDLPTYERILLLHYLTTQNDFAAHGEVIQFKNLPGVSFYEPTYRKRSTDRLVRTFGGDPDSLVRAGEVLGGTGAGMGDASVRIPVFPKIAATVVIHAADEEFPAEATILYDDTVGIHLPTEDVAVLGGVLATQLKIAASTE